MDFTLVGLGIAYLMTGRNDEAYIQLRRGVEELPKWAPGHRGLVLVCTRLGRLEEARAAAARLMENIPDFRISTMSRPYADNAFIEEYANALRGVGVPE